MARIASTRAALALAALGGALYFAAFPPLDRGVLAFVALVPLLLAVRGQSRLRALWLGWIMGTVAAYTLVAAPIWVAATRFAPERPWIAWFLALTIPQVYGALYFALFALAAREIYARRLSPALEAPVLAAAWTACEFGRAVVGEGCPWNLLAHSQHERLWLLQIADVGGAAGVSFTVALVNAALALSIRRAEHGDADVRRKLGAIAASLAVVAAVAVYGAVQLWRWSAPQASLRVALVQGDVPDEWRYSLRGLPQAMRRLEDLTDRALAGGPHLVVWPENAVTVSVADNQRLFASLAGRLPSGARLLVGAPRAVSGGRGVASLRNSAYLIDGDGGIRRVYDKLRLTPYGESLPEIAGAFVGEATSRDGRYEPGSEWTLFEVAGHRFATVICYEAIYAGLVRRFVEDGAEFLVNISNDGWFGAQPSLEQHFNAVALRAVENRRFLLRATNAGITAVIDPRGAVVAAVPRARASVLEASIVPIDALTIYTRWGDWFAWLCVAVTLASIASMPGRRSS